MADRETIVVNAFHEVPAEDYPSMPMIVVYANTTDFPNMFVARLWFLNRPTAYAVIKKTYQEIKDAIPEHMIYMEPYDQDDSVIIATFI